MRGTVVCGVDDLDGGRGALGMAVALSDRLDMRLVLVHVGGGLGSTAGNGTQCADVPDTARDESARLVARLAVEHGVSHRAEPRSAAGDPAAVIGRIAAEEAADLIVVGSRPRGRLRRGFVSRLAEQLAGETTLPILIAPPRRPCGRMAV